MNPTMFSFVSGDCTGLYPNGSAVRGGETDQTLRYGFVFTDNRDLYDCLRIPELSDNFIKNPDTLGCAKPVIEQYLEGIGVEWEGPGYIPLTFATDVSHEGNFEVEITVNALKDCDEVLLFTQRRRLCFRGSLKKGESRTVTALVNVCPIIPGNHENRPEDDKTLDITLIGKGVVLSFIRINASESPTIYIMGDSTVADQGAEYPYLPELNYCGWGQMLSAYVESEAAVSNHAHGGLSTRSCINEGHYSIVINRIKKGDICLIQFGHNDQKIEDLKAYGGYTSRLEIFVADILERGGVPVIVSSLARNTWKADGTYNDLLWEYAKACEDLATRLNIPYIDLHKESMELIIKNGREGSKRYFHPGDYTHTNDQGGFLFAGMIYKGLKSAGLLKEYKEQDAWEPSIPFRSIESSETLNEVSKQPPLFESIDRPDDDLTRIEAVDLIVPALKFFSTNESGEGFEDTKDLKAGAISLAAALQNGIIPENMINDGKFYPYKAITRKEFIDLLRRGLHTRITSDIKAEELFLWGEGDDTPIKRSEAAKLCNAANAMI